MFGTTFSCAIFRIFQITDGITPKMNYYINFNQQLTAQSQQQKQNKMQNVFKANFRYTRMTSLNSVLFFGVSRPLNRPMSFELCPVKGQFQIINFVVMQRKSIYNAKRAKTVKPLSKRLTYSSIERGMFFTHLHHRVIIQTNNISIYC